MNVVLFDPTQKADDQFVGSVEHQCAMAMGALRAAVNELDQLTYNPQARDLLSEDDERGDLYGARMALQLITERIETRLHAVEETKRNRRK